MRWRCSTHLDRQERDCHKGQATHGDRDGLGGQPREQKHHPALPYNQVGWAIAQVRESTANLLTKLAFEFLVLTAARSGEVRKANWGEIRWDKRTWEIPAIKMKARRLYRVPLSERAMEILNEAWAISGPGGPVFPSRPGGRAMSDMTLTVLLRRLGIPAVQHGFRRVLQELGRRTHGRMGDGSRGRPGASGQKQDRVRIYDHRPFRAANKH